MADRSSSSTSSSDPSSVESHHEPGLTGFRVLFATLIGLAILLLADVSINRVFKMPASTQAMPSALQQYFDYGRSVEGKLRRMIGAGSDEVSPVAKAGWLSDESKGLAKAQPGKISMAVYGQSFTFFLADAVQLLDDDFQIVAKRGGPAAPLSHSHALYAEELGQAEPKIVLIGVLASSLPKLVSLTNMTSSFESPVPYTYPRYHLEGGKLLATQPRVRSLPAMRAALGDADAWGAFVAQLRAHDLAFDASLFMADGFDHSAFARLLRRSYGQHRLNRLEQIYHGRAGFTNRDQLLDVAEALLGDVARIAAERGQMVVVLLIHDRGYGDHLVTGLGPYMDAHKIPYFSTHIVAPTTDSRNYKADGHFTDGVNLKLAKVLKDQLHAAWRTRLAGPR
jgi:hypothetical protein